MEDLRGRLWTPMSCQSLTDANTYEIHRARYVGTREVLPNSAKNDCALHICSGTSFAMHPTTLWLWAGTTCPGKRDDPGRSLDGSLEVRTPTYKKYFASELDIRGGHGSNFAREIPAVGEFQTCLTRKSRLNDSRIPQILKKSQTDMYAGDLRYIFPQTHTK